MCSSEKRFCLGVNELSAAIEEDEELKRFFAQFIIWDLSELLESVRNFPHVEMSGLNNELIDKLADLGFIRMEFYSPFIAERQLQALFKLGICVEGISGVFDGNTFEYREEPRFLKRYEEWFFDFERVDGEEKISNGLYETYDFERNEGVIMSIIDQLGLPPIQKEYANHFLKMKSDFEFSGFETDILKSVGKNLLNHDGDICYLLDKLLKS